MDFDGDQREGGDVDLPVDFKRPVGLFRFVGLRRYFSERLGARVDLVTAAALKADFRDRALGAVQYVGN